MHDPIADPQEARHEYGIRLEALSEMQGLDGAILAVGHQAYLEMANTHLTTCVRPGGVFMDVKSVIDSDCLPSDVHYWCL